MKMPFLLISPKIVPKIQLIKKGGCFEYHAVIADKIKYRYVHRASICPALGMDRRSFFMPKPMGKYKRLEVFYLSKPVYTADKPSDCHYCYFWTNGRKGCRLGRNNCYYLISLPPKPKSECDGCPYGRDHPCIGWCTKKVTDNHLYLMVLEHYSGLRGIDIHAMTVPVFLKELDRRSFPGFETVRRSRQKVQATYPDLAPSEAVGKRRAKNEVVYREFAESEV